MKYLILIVALFAAQASASEYTYSVGGSKAKTSYCWYGASEACFDYKMDIARFEVQHESGFAVRVAKAMNKPTSTQTTITNQVFKINFDNYKEVELIYKHNVNNSLVVYAGLGYYFQTVPIYSFDDVLIKYDEDNDNGYLIGMMYNVSDKLSIDFMVKQTSAIGKAGGSCNSQCIVDWEAKGSTIRQIGLGFMFKF
tara:strand:- start:11809 stop:12396 length:588 start_codon:yes stop_codon:yes gene_type:complete